MAQTTNNHWKRVPHKRRGKRSFSVGGRFVPTKQAMTALCQELMALAPAAPKQFRSATLTDLIAKYHYFCPMFDLKPDRFRKDPPRIGYSRDSYYLMGHFEGVKGDGWHGVSWRKCLTHPSFESEVTEGFRRKILNEILSVKGSICELCSTTFPLQVDHSDPTFKEIMAEVMPLFSAEERSTWCGFDWREYEEFTLPDNHIAMKEFQRIHRQSTLTTLCIPHHIELTKKRKGDDLYG